MGWVTETSEANGAGVRSSGRHSSQRHESYNKRSRKIAAQGRSELSGNQSYCNASAAEPSAAAAATPLSADGLAWSGWLKNSCRNDCTAVIRSAGSYVIIFRSRSTCRCQDQCLCGPLYNVNTQTFLQMAKLAG